MCPRHVWKTSHEVTFSIDLAADPTVERRIPVNAVFSRLVTSLIAQLA